MTMPRYDLELLYDRILTFFYNILAPDSSIDTGTGRRSPPTTHTQLHVTFGRSSRYANHAICRRWCDSISVASCTQASSVFWQLSPGMIYAHTWFPCVVCTATSAAHVVRQWRASRSLGPG